MQSIFGLDAWVRPEVIAELSVAFFTGCLALATFLLALLTWRMLKLGEKERRDKVMPVAVPVRFSLEWDPERKRTRHLHIHNVGPGPALQVTVLGCYAGKTAWFHRTALGAEEKSEEVRLVFSVPAGTWASDMRLVIDYEDVFGQKFTTQCHKDGISKDRPQGLPWTIAYIGPKRPK